MREHIECILSPPPTGLSYADFLVVLSFYLFFRPGVRLGGHLSILFIISLSRITDIYIYTLGRSVLARRINAYYYYCMNRFWLVNRADGLIDGLVSSTSILDPPCNTLCLLARGTLLCRILCVFCVCVQLAHGGDYALVQGAGLEIPFPSGLKYCRTPSAPEPRVRHSSLKKTVRESPERKKRPGAKTER